MKAKSRKMKVSEGDAKVPHSQITNFVVIKVFPVNVVLMRRCWTNSSPFACHSEAVTILLQSRVPGCFASTLNFHFTFQSVCPKHVDSMPLAQGPCQVLSLSQSVHPETEALFFNPAPPQCAFLSWNAQHLLLLLELTWKLYGIAFLRCCWTISHVEVISPTGHDGPRKVRVSHISLDSPKGTRIGSQWETLTNRPQKFYSRLRSVILEGKSPKKEDASAF